MKKMLKQCVSVTSELSKGGNIDGALGPAAVVLGAPGCGNVSVMADFFPDCFTGLDCEDHNKNKAKVPSANEIPNQTSCDTDDQEVQRFLNDSYSLRLCLAQGRVSKSELSSGLSEAAFYGSVECSMALLEHGADPNVRLSHRAGTPLCNACMRGHSEVVMLLLEHGCDINLRANSNGYTALHHAAEHANVVCLEMLLQRNCDTSIKNYSGETVYNLLNKLKQVIPEVESCIETFNSYKCRLKVPFRDNALHTACETGDLSAAERHLVNKAIDVNEVRDKDNATPLVVAVKMQNLSMIKLLLTSPNLNINLSCNGKTALHWAILTRNLKFVLILLRGGFRLNSKQLQSFETSPLILAIQICERTIVEALGVYCDRVARYYPCEFQTGQGLAGMTPLMMAFYTGDEDLINSLVDFGADIKNCLDFESVLTEAHKHRKLRLRNLLACYYMGVSDLKGHTLLTKAAEMNNLSMMQMLSNCGMDPNVPNSSDMTALAIACKSKNEKLVNILLKFGARPNKFGVCVTACKASQYLSRHVHRSPLMISCIHGNAAITKNLLKFGADPNLGDPCSSKKPLLLAIENRQDTAIIRELVLAGSYIASIFNQDSPMMAAIRRQNIPAFKLLLASNCQLGVKGEDIVLDEYPLKVILTITATTNSICALKVLLVACSYYLYRRVVLHCHSLITFREAIVKHWSPVHSREVTANCQDSIALLEDLSTRVFSLQEICIQVIRDCLPNRMILKGDLSCIPCPKNLVNLIMFSREALKFFGI